MNWPEISWFEIAAVIGALAWLYPIIVWLNRVFTKPMVSFVTDSNVEIGFTSYGPILNVMLGIVCYRKDIILHNMQIDIKHEDGEHHVFGWQGMTSYLGSVTAQGMQIPLEKHQNAIAIRIPAGGLEERFVRFHKDDFVDSINTLTMKAGERLIKIQKEKRDYYHDDVLKSDEISKCLEKIRHSIIWKEGRYEFRITASSTARFKVTKNRFFFNLTVPEVECLQKNTAMLEREYENLIKANLKGYTPHQVSWYWAHPKVVRPNRSVEGMS